MSPDDLLTQLAQIAKDYKPGSGYPSREAMLYALIDQARCWDYLLPQIAEAFGLTLDDVHKLIRIHVPATPHGIRYTVDEHGNVVKVVT